MRNHFLIETAFTHRKFVFPPLEKNGQAHVAIATKGVSFNQCCHRKFSKITRFGRKITSLQNQTFDDFLCQIEVSYHI